MSMNYTQMKIMSSPVPVLQLVALKPDLFGFVTLAVGSTDAYRLVDFILLLNLSPQKQLLEVVWGVSGDKGRWLWVGSSAGVFSV